jgi:pimeloyl-ACP methyl ester carboxylesterase
MADAGLTEGGAPGAGVELRHLTAAGRDGAGRVLVVHGIASDADAWAPEAVRLAAATGATVTVYDRRGYGGSTAPRPYGATTVAEQAEDAAALLRALDAPPALVAGEGFGALVALDLARRHKAAVRALALADPPLLQFVAEGAEALSTQRAALEDALRNGGPAEAVARYLGPAADPARVARAQRAHLAFFADVAGLPSWPVTRRELRAIAVPAVVATTPAAPAHLVAAADALAGLMPAATRSPDTTLTDAIAALAPT